MDSSTPTTTPLPPRISLSIESTNSLVDPDLYYSMVGKLIYLTNSRSNISFSVGLVSRFMQDPRMDHLQAINHIFRYLHHIEHHGIFYKHNVPISLIGYTNANWASCPTTR